MQILPLALIINSKKNSFSRIGNSIQFSVKFHTTESCQGSPEGTALLSIDTDDVVTSPFHKNLLFHILILGYLFFINYFPVVFFSNMNDEILKNMETKTSDKSLNLQMLVADEILTEFKGVLLQLYEHADNNHQLETGHYFLHCS